MATSQNGVTIDVSARITGYQADLEKFKRAVQNVDPGSKVGQALGKMLSEYEHRIESISKNSQITVFSDKQLDSALEKMNNIDRLGLTIGQTLSNIKIENLNFAGITGEMQNVLTSISAVHSELEGLSSLKASSILKDLPALAEALQALGINTIGAGIENVGKALTGKFSGAVKEVEKYTEALHIAENAQQSLKDAYSTKQATSGFLGQDPVTFKKELDDAIAQMLPGNMEQSKQKIDSFLNTFGAYMSDEAMSKIQNSLKAGDFSGFAKEVEKGLQEARETYRKELDKIAKEIQTKEQEITGLKEKLSGAQAKQASIGGTIKDYNAQLTPIENKIKELESRLAQLEQRRDALGAGVQAQVKGAGDDIGAGSAARLADAQTAAERYHAALKQVSAAERGLGSLQSLAGRWFSVYGAINLCRRAIKSMIQDITQLDKTINQISIVTTFSMDELWAQIPKYTAMAQQYGVAISGVYEVSQLYYQQGLKTAEVNELTASTLQLAKISGLDYSTATNYMTNAIRSFKMEMDQANTVTDAYAALAASSASSVQELATAMSKTASSAQAVGMTMQETSAMMAVMIEATREAPENIGSAMKSIISRYGEMTSDPSKLVDSEGQEMSLNKVDKALQTVGITLQDSQGQFRSFTDVITELAGKWDGLSANTQRYIATVMAGNRQQSRFLALVSSGERLQQLTKVANESEGTGQLQTLKTMDTIESKAQQAKTALQEIYNTQGLQDMIKGWYDFEKAIGNFYAKIAQIGKVNFAANIILQFTSMAIALKNIFNVTRAAITTFARKGEADVTNNHAAEVNKREAKDREEHNLRRSNMAGTVNATASDEAKITGIRAKFSNWRNKHQTGIDNTVRTTGALGGAVMSLVGNDITMHAAQMAENTSEERQAKSDKTVLGSGLTGAGLGMSMGSSFGIYGMLAGTLVGGALGILTSAQNAAEIAYENTEEKLNRLKSDYETKNNKVLESKSELQNLKSLKEQYDSLYKARNTSNEAMQEYQELCNSIASAHTELIAGYDTEGNAILDMADAYERLYEIKRKQMLQDQREALIARYNYNTDIDKQMEDANVQYINGNTVAYNTFGVKIGQGQKFGENAMHLGQVGAQGALSAHKDAYSVYYDALWNQLWESGNVYQRGYLDARPVIQAAGGIFGPGGVVGAGVAIGQTEEARQAAEAARISKAVSKAYGGEELADLYKYENGHMNFNYEAFNQMVGNFIQLYADSVLTSEQIATEINKSLQDNGLNDPSFFATKEYIDSLRKMSEMADVYDRDQKNREEVASIINDYTYSVFAGSDEYSGIEIAFYREKITAMADELSKDNTKSVGEILDEIMKGMETDRGQYSIGEVLKGSELENASQKKLDQLTDLWNKINEYNDTEYEAMLDALGIDSNGDLRNELDKQRRKVTGKQTKRFKDLITKDLIITSGLQTNGATQGINNYKELSILSNEQLARWIGQERRDQEGNIYYEDGLFSASQLENIGVQFSDIANDKNMLNYTKELLLARIRDMYEGIMTSETISDSDKSSLVNLISRADLKTREGIQALEEDLQAYGISLSDTEGVGYQLQQLLQTIQINVVSGMNTYINNLSTQVKNFGDELKKGFEGMDFSDALKMASELNVNFDSEHFQFKGGKFYFTDINAMINHSIAEIFKQRDEYVSEIRDDMELIHNSVDSFRQSLQNGRIVYSRSRSRSVSVIDLINEYGATSDTTDWESIFEQEGITSEAVLAGLQNYQYLYDKGKNTKNKQFNEWVRSSTDVWQAWIDIATANDDHALDLLQSLTGLNAAEAASIQQELLSVWTTWKNDQQLQNDYRGVFLDYAYATMQQLEGIANFSRSTVEYMMASMAIPNNGLESWWDNNETIKEAFKNSPFDESVVKTRILTALRNYDWNTVEEYRTILGEAAYNEILRYGELFYQNYENLTKESFSAMANSITQGTQYIKITDANQAILETFGTDATGRSFSDDNPIQNYVYAMLDLSSESNERLNEFLSMVQNDTNALKGRLKTDTIAAIQKAIGERSLQTVVGKIVNTYESFTYDVAAALGQLVNKTVEELESMRLITYDSILGTYSTDPTRLAEILALNGLSLGNQNQLKAQLDTHAYSLGVTSAVSAIIKNYNNIQTTALATLADVSNQDYTALIDRYAMEKNADGTYKIQLRQLRDLIKTVYSLAREDIPNEIYEQLNDLYDSIISEVTNIPNTMRSGFTKTVDMQKYVDMINDSGLFSETFTMLGSNGLFKWSEALHAYTYSTTGLIAQIQYFYNNLDEMTAEQKEATKQLLADNARQLAAAIDIKGYISSGRTELDWAPIGQAFDMYVQYVGTLNAEIQKRNREIADARERVQLWPQQQQQLEKQKQFLEQREIGWSGNYIPSPVSYNEQDIKLAQEQFQEGIKTPFVDGRTVMSSREARVIIEAGGRNALMLASAVYEAAGKALTQEDITTIYRAEISQYTETVSKNLTAKVGDIVDAETHALMEGVDGYEFDTQLADKGIYLITAIGDNLNELYQAYYDRLRSTHEASFKELNEAYVNVLNTSETWGQNEQGAIDILSKAAGLTYAELADYFTSMGWLLTDQIMSDLESNKIIQRIGGNKIAITDWAKFAQLAGYEFNSPEYVSGLSAYNDAIIKMNEDTQTQIENEIGKLSSAKQGSKLNFTYFTTQLYDAIYKNFVNENENVFPDTSNELEQAANNYANGFITNLLLQYGAYFQNGMLVLRDNANIMGIIQTIAREGQQAGILLESEVAQLNDTLNTMFQNYINIIKKGITGVLTNSDILDLNDFIEAYGFDIQLDYTSTLSGIKLTTDSIFQLYDAVRSVDAIAGQTLFTELVSNLQSSNTELSTMAGVLGKIKALEAERNSLLVQGNGAEDARVKTLQQELSIYQQMARYMQISQPESYKLFDSNGAFSGVQGFNNFISQFGTLSKTLKTAGENGYMSFTDFEAWARGMTQMALSIDDEITSCGITFDAAGQTYARLMESARISFTESGETVIDITNLGPELNFNAAGAMAQGKKNNDAIKAYADQQVHMLDSIIQVLEIMVAMEELGDLDVEGDNVLSFDNIFTVTDGIIDYRTGVRKVAHDILQASQSNDDLAAALNNFKIGEQTLAQVLGMVETESADALIRLMGSQEAAAALFDWLYSGALEDYDPANPTAIFNILQEKLQEHNALGEIPLEFTIDEITYSFTTRGLVTYNTEQVNAIAQEIANKSGRDITQIKQHLITTLSASIQDLLNSEDTEDLAFYMAMNSSYTVNIGEDGKYHIQIGSESIDWIPGQEDENPRVRQALLAELFLKDFTSDKKTTSIQWEEGGSPYVEVSLGTKNQHYTVRVNGDETGVDYSFTYNNQEYTGDSLDKALQAAYNAWLADPFNALDPESSGSRSFKNNKQFQEVLGIDTLFTTELTSGNISAIQGLRDRVFAAWQKGKTDNSDFLTSDIKAELERLDFDLTEITTWDELANALGFSETNVAIMGSFEGEYADQVATLLGAITGGGDLEPVGATIVAQVTDADGNVLQQTIAQRYKIVTEGDDELVTDSDGDYDYTLQATLVYDQESNTMIKQIQRISKDGTILAEINYSESGELPRLNDLKEILDEHGKVPVEIHYSEDLNGKKTLTATFLEEHGATCVVCYEDDDNTLKKLWAKTYDQEKNIVKEVKYNDDGSVEELWFNKDGTKYCLVKYQDADKSTILELTYYNLNDKEIKLTYDPETQEVKAMEVKFKEGYSTSLSFDAENSLLNLETKIAGLSRTIGIGFSDQTPDNLLDALNTILQNPDGFTITLANGSKAPIDDNILGALASISAIIAGLNGQKGIPNIVVPGIQVDPNNVDAIIQTLLEGPNQTVDGKTIVTRVVTEDANGKQIVTLDAQITYDNVNDPNHDHPILFDPDVHTGERYEQPVRYLISYYLEDEGQDNLMDKIQFLGQYDNNGNLIQMPLFTLLSSGDTTLLEAIQGLMNGESRTLNLSATVMPEVTSLVTALDLLTAAITGWDLNSGINGEARRKAEQEIEEGQQQGYTVPETEQTETEGERYANWLEEQERRAAEERERGRKRAEKLEELRTDGSIISTDRLRQYGFDIDENETDDVVMVNGEVFYKTGTTNQRGSPQWHEEGALKSYLRSALEEKERIRVPDSVQTALGHMITHQGLEVDTNGYIQLEENLFYDPNTGIIYTTTGRDAAIERKRAAEERAETERREAERRAAEEAAEEAERRAAEEAERRAAEAAEQAAAQAAAEQQAKQAVLDEYEGLTYQSGSLEPVTIGADNVEYLGNGQAGIRINPGPDNNNAIYAVPNSDGSFTYYKSNGNGEYTEVTGVEAEALNFQQYTPPPTVVEEELETPSSETPRNISFAPYNALAQFFPRIHGFSSFNGDNYKSIIDLISTIFDSEKTETEVTEALNSLGSFNPSEIYSVMLTEMLTNSNFGQSVSQDRATRFLALLATLSEGNPDLQKFFSDIIADIGQPEPEYIENGNQYYDALENKGEIRTHLQELLNNENTTFSQLISFLNSIEITDPITQYRLIVDAIQQLEGKSPQEIITLLMRLLNNQEENQSEQRAAQEEEGRQPESGNPPTEAPTEDQPSSTSETPSTSTVDAEFFRRWYSGLQVEKDSDGEKMLEATYGGEPQDDYDYMADLIEQFSIALDAGELGVEAVANDIGDLIDSVLEASHLEATPDNKMALLQYVLDQFQQLGISLDQSEIDQANQAIQHFASGLQVVQEDASNGIRLRVRVKAETEDGGEAEVVGNSEFTLGSQAKGNVALAGGRSTLMGELGPELVVSNGRYFVVGQNGAEFVNLADDAIVFNHLQTRSLLNNGRGGHGRPVTNERKATSFAKGNVTGPAYAGASDALATLKALRNMWKNIADRGLSELAQQAGQGGGGGGGGGGNKDNAAYLADLERWYNLLREVDRLEQDITYQESLRSKIEKDRVIDGKAYYDSQKESIKLLEEEIAKKHELVILQKQYYESRRKDLEASPFGQFIAFDEHGHLQFKEAYSILQDLESMNPDGSTKYTAQEQYDKLVAMGFETYMKYDTQGKEIDMSGDDAYTNAVKTFFEKLDSQKEDLDDLYDDFEKYQEDILKLEDKYNELLQKIIDNQISLENRIEKAIEDQRQREIDEAKSQKDALQKSTEQFIQGLSDSLDKERKMYERSQSDNELNRLRRQLAILQRSGGSASQIRSLQQDITSKEQDQYFNTQQDQIDAIQKASDAEMERLDHQISIMEESLKYEKEHGLLWAQVSDIMSQTPEEIEQFLLTNSKDLESKSTLQIAEDLRKIKSEIEQWIGYRDDSDNPIAAEPQHNWNSYYAGAKNAYNLDEETDALTINQAKAAYDQEYDHSKDENAAARAADQIFEAQFGSRSGAITLAPTDSYYTTPTSEKPRSGGGGGGGNNPKQGGTAILCLRVVGTNCSVRMSIPAGGNYTVTAANAQAAAAAASNGNITYRAVSWNPTVISNVVAGQTYNVNVQCDSGHSWRVIGIDENGRQHTKEYNNITRDEAQARFLNDYPNLGIRIASITQIPRLAGYKKGGLADYTGLAMVHGSPKDPEAFLNAEETHMWRDKILSGNTGSLTSMLLEFQDMVSGMVSSDNYSEIGLKGQGINIENATVNMNATISNDYDARRAADTVMEEMVRIARKTTAQQARR